MHVLSDPEKRQRYDQLGAHWKTGADFTPPPGWEGGHVEYGDFGDLFGAGRGSGGFSDFFATLFGARRGPRAGAGFAMRGQDVEAAIELSLEEAHHGDTRTITLHDTAVCPTCNGSGMQEQTTLRDVSWRGRGDAPKNTRCDHSRLGYAMARSYAWRGRVNPAQAMRPLATCSSTSSSDPIHFFTYWAKVMWRSSCR